MAKKRRFVLNALPRRLVDRRLSISAACYAYHQIDRGNPVAFFGMVHVLEGTSTALATQAADTMRSTLMLPPEAFSYLSSHGSLDIEHVAFYERLMNRLDDEADRQAVIHMARMMYGLYGNVFRSLPCGERLFGQVS